MAELFGFEFKRKGVKQEEDIGSFAPKIDDEGSVTVLTEPMLILKARLELNLS